MRSQASKARPSSNGSKAVTCVRCKGEIQPYAGRQVAFSKYAHHAGQCKDAGEHAAIVRKAASEQGTLFAWRCERIDVDAGSAEAYFCHESGTDREAFTAHMRDHGARVDGGFAPVRLRKRAPAAPRVAPLVPPFKQLRWIERRYSEWKPGVGNELIAEVERRGQYWSNADTPNSVWVIPAERAPWESTARPPAPVQLYLTGIPGQYTTDWSAARSERREAKRRASRLAA
jgi:hypothetical protein